MAEATQIRQKSRKRVKFNPFPGLRPFTVNESHLFFGREGQSDEVLKKLAENKFTAVIGASGSGKSSLMYCGVIPTVYGGFISKAGDSWRMVVTRPGNAPIDNLAKAIVESEPDHEGGSEEKLRIQRTMNSAILRSSSKGLVEALRQVNQKRKQNILLLIDQFEELFRFKKSAENVDSANESAEFVRLFLEAANQSEVPIYVVLTMRSDFIGDCAQFPSLTEKINDSHYLIPQMTRNDMQNAIEGPVAVGGGKISPHLVQQLLNEVGDNPDQLPILQHALMRTWDAWENSIEDEAMINIDHYDSIGRMEKALSNHANEAYDELSEGGKRICENLFKTLTEKGGDNRGIRRPTALLTVADICHAPMDEVKEVVEKFRVAGRSFLAPSSSVKLESDTIVDISHESLMRIWDRLIVWVDEEATAVNTYVRIADAAALYQVGKASLWRPPDLQLALNWKEKKEPTLKWAERYDPSFERAMVFLQTSKDTYEAEERNKILQQKRALKRSRIVAIVLGTAAVIALFLTLWAFIQQQKAEEKEKEALEAKANAEVKEKEANLAKEDALKQKAIAEEKEQEALVQKALADSAKVLAELSAAEALRQKGIALQKEKEANRQKVIAEEKEAEAQKQKTLAEQKEKEAIAAQLEADKLRMLSISKAMAIKSAQMRRDTTRKALLAYQSYIFNDEYKGEEHNADVYDGLYSTLKSLNQEEYNSLEGHTDAIRALNFSNEGTLYSTGSDGKIMAWDTESSTSPFKTVYSDDKIKRTMVVSPDNKSLAVGDESSNIKLVNIASGDASELKDHTKAVWALTYDKEGNLYSTSADSTLRVWNNGTSKILTNGQLIRTVSVYGDNIACGQMNSKLTIWNKSNGSLVKSLDEASPVYSVAYSPDGKLLACGDLQGNIKIYDSKSYELITSLRGHTARVHEIEFSQDGSQMATASFDKTVLLWKTADFNVTPISMRDHEGWVVTMAFSPDGTKLIAGCIDNVIRVWPTDIKSMAEQICEKLKRNMTQKEWEKYVAKDIPYEKTCDALPVGEGVKPENE